MLKRIFTIAFLYLKTTYSSRTTFIFSIAMPLLFTFILGAAMAETDPEAGQFRTQLGVVDEDGSFFSALLIERLESNPSVELVMYDREAALAELEDVLSAAVVIPRGFGFSVAEGEQTEVTVYQNTNEFSQAQLLFEAVNSAVAQIAGSLAAADIATNVAQEVGLFEGADDTAIERYHSTAFTEAENAWSTGAPVGLETATISRVETSRTPNGVSQSAPGMLVMFALFFTFNGGAVLLVEREEGTLRRLLVMPMGKGTLIAGKLMGIYLGALVQMTVMVLAGHYLFNVEWGKDNLALALMLMAYGLAGTALGLMLAALSKTPAQAGAAGTIAMMALASLGGAWWPIEIVPPWMQSFALALPTGWAMRGFHDIITRGLDLNAVLLEAGVLGGFTILFLAIGIWRFRYE